MKATQVEDAFRLLRALSEVKTSVVAVMNIPEHLFGLPDKYRGLSRRVSLSDTCHVSVSEETWVKVRDLVRADREIEAARIMARLAEAGVEVESTEAY